MKLKNRFLTSRVDRLIGPVLSAVFAASLGFALLAMPADLMGALLMAPPVDVATRLLVATVVALLGGGAVWALFRWLDRTPAPPREDEADEWDFDDIAPQVVTRGDAPPRPIFAGADLGTVGAPAAISAPTPAPAPAPEAAPADEDALLLEMELTPEVEEVLASPVSGGQAPVESASLDDLMRRLEAGIEGRTMSPAPAARSGANQDALRNALSELKRMAARPA